MRLFLIVAIVVGAAAGFIWSTPYAVIKDARTLPASQRPPAANLTDVPPTAEDAEADQAWSAGQPLGANDRDSKSADASAPAPSDSDTNSEKAD